MRLVYILVFYKNGTGWDTRMLPVMAILPTGIKTALQPDHATVQWLPAAAMPTQDLHSWFWSCITSSPPMPRPKYAPLSDALVGYEHNTRSALARRDSSPR
jgi:hypothetical protein